MKTATAQQKLDAADLLIEEGAARVERGLEADEPRDADLGLLLIQAAEVLVSDAALEAH